MIDYTAVVEGVLGGATFVGAAFGWVRSRHMRHVAKIREIETRVAQNAAALKSHEDSCGSRYAEINGTLGTIQDHLVKQDRDSEAHRGAVAISLREITDKFHAVDKAVTVLGVLEERRKEERA